ncbi:MAG: 3-isopropylmalate dehydratase large subunit [Chloroflexota bacterium]
MTVAEQILAAHCGRETVGLGDFINARVDLILANDITAPLSIREFERIGAKEVFDPAKVVLVPDHFCPNKDIRSAEQAKLMREFAKLHGLRYYEVGRAGIEHVVLPEKGLVRPGEVIVGADSHTCTYGALGAFATGMGSTDVAVAMATGEIWMKVPASLRFLYHGALPEWVDGKDLILYTLGKIGIDGALYSVMEFAGEAIDALDMDSRFTMANMATEAGAKAGMCAVDEKARAYLAQHRNAYEAKNSYQPASGSQGDYAGVFEYDVSSLEPQVALPHLPSNVRPVSQVEATGIDQVVIGSCTNGRLGDLRVAARILAGRLVHDDVRCIVIPGSQQVYLEALREGLIDQFVEAGAAVSTPTCGPCLGGYMGVLAAGERCVSTTNRNFVGRMGSPQSEVYLANPAVAAASAVLGRVAAPQEVV